LNGGKTHVVTQGQGNDLAHTGRIQFGQLHAVAGGSVGLAGTDGASGADA
jgi:hypothetical protein